MALNTITAERYVSEYVRSAELTGAIVNSAHVIEWNDHGEPEIIRVPFIWDNHEYTMDVWVESDRLYGEW